jgi:hypothetical protein
MMELDETHDPALESWVESANDPATDFPIQNLPFGRFRRPEDADWSIGVAIGDQVLGLRRAGLIDHDDMNLLMQFPEPRRALRQACLTDCARKREAGAVQPGSPQTSVQWVCRATSVHTRIYPAFITPPRGKLFRRQPVAAQLQVGADRISRAGVVDPGERPRVQPPGRLTKAQTTRSERRAVAPSRLRTEVVSSSRGRTHTASRSMGSPSTCSGWHCSTTERAGHPGVEYQLLGPFCRKLATRYRRGS